MNAVLSGMSLAFWLGILTSISPCPLASNIAAVSWLGSKPGRPKRVLAAGLLYTLGRIVTYTTVGFVLSFGALSLSATSLGLQRYGSMALGPVLVLAGVFLLELIRIRLPSTGILAAATEQPKRWGLWGAPVLGMIFALSFCPVSGALFFGSLVPLAARTGQPLIVSALYGIGTAVPVVAVSLAIAAGGDVLAKRFAGLSRFEGVARRLTGVVFIGAGIYLSLKYIFNIVP
ncbi:MAG: aromatic aminobenezylarsenical efflux permease ArsG family transporter [Spirochaetes bacterium]|nr:aromatic aminobenezylarsenical efflux permease ArsG family transporter [Spirochaetota bacterium]